MIKFLYVNSYANEININNDVRKDSPIGESDARSLTAGVIYIDLFLYQVVRGNLRRECKCHGVTGSCSLKTCWKELGAFENVGSELKKIYHNAAPVKFVDNKLQERIDRQLRAVSVREKRLVYLDSSPDYCVQNHTVGSPGMLGRTCRGDEASAEKCKSLCDSCRLQHHTVEQYKQIKCRCKFVWCCSVKCDICTTKYSVTTCTRQ